MNSTDEVILKPYLFTPTVGNDGIIDYTGVAADKIYLANRKTILEQDLPSYLPPIAIRRDIQYDIPAYKVKDNEYLLLESKHMVRGEDGTLLNPRIYRVSLDVYAALVNYHLDYDRAAFAAIAKHNENERLDALNKGETKYTVITESSTPRVPVKLDIATLKDKKNTYAIHTECKPSRVSYKSSNTKRMSVEPYYFIRDMQEDFSRKDIFRMHKECLDNVHQKLLDMELQKADFESSWTKGRETAYGDSNLETSLLAELGIKVKRQNGDLITATELAEVKAAIELVHSVYGDLSSTARDFGLKVSHAGTTKMHASKYIGVFSSYHNAIGISFAGGLKHASLTASHEYAHFLDHLSGKEIQAWHASDIPGTLENTIAVRFRTNMNRVSGGYWNRTCECFARAMEEYTHITMLRKENPEITIKELDKHVSKDAFVDCFLFDHLIAPFTKKLVEEYQERFSIDIEKATPTMAQDAMETPVANMHAPSIDTQKDYKNYTFSQLELFESGSEYLLREHSENNYTETDSALTREHIRSAKAAMRTYVKPVLEGDKCGLWKTFRNFKKQGIFNIVGSSIETDSAGTVTENGWKQMYQALNIYRDKRFETFRILFITPDGVINDQLAISSHLPNCVNVSKINTELKDSIITHAEKTNSKIVLVHNHPSGNIQPSIQDEDLTYHLVGLLTGKDNSTLVQGHIILDHDSFSLYEIESGWNPVVLEKQRDPLMKTRNPDFTKVKISNENSLSKVARQINENDRWNSTDWVPVLFADCAAKVSGLRYYSKQWVEKTTPEKVIKEFQSSGIKTGAVWAFPILNEELSQDIILTDSIRSLMKAGCFRDYYIAGETAQEAGYFGQGIYANLSREEMITRTTIDSTYALESTKTENENEIERRAEIEHKVYKPTHHLDALFKTRTIGTLETEIKSISRNDIGNVNKYITITNTTPVVFQKLGLQDHQITMYRDKLARALYLNPAPTNHRPTHGHSDGLDETIIKRVFDSLANPYYVFKSKDEQSLIGVYDILDKNGEPVIVALNYNSDRNGVEANWVKSLYGKTEQGIERWAQNELLVYVNDKNKATELPITLQLRVMDSSAAYTKNIITKTDFVNNEVKSIESKYRLMTEQDQFNFDNNEQEMSLKIKETENLTKTIEGSYNIIEETQQDTEVLDDDSNSRGQASGMGEGVEVPTAIPSFYQNGKEGERESFSIHTSRHADVSARADMATSEWENLSSRGNLPSDREFSQGSFFVDSDGSRGVRPVEMPSTEMAGQRGEHEIGSRQSRNGNIKQTPRAIRDIRQECLKILETKKDAEITNQDRVLLTQYEGAGGLGEKDATAAGVLSEFYTPDNIISKVWSLVDAYAPNTISVMEPSAGTGRFASGRENNTFTLYELDETSSRIAKILHPEATVIPGAFQKQFFDTSVRILNKEYLVPKYDAVIGNPPYGAYSGSWKGLGEGQHHRRYEEYFIEKGLDSLKEDGILTYVVPSGFLRSGKDSIKELLASKGILIDAWRLPNGAFPTTEIGTDIIVMKKGIGDPEHLSNDYFFINSPEHILGEENKRQGRFGQEKYVAIPEGDTLENVLGKIIPVSHYTRNKSIKRNNNDEIEIAEPLQPIVLSIKEMIQSEPQILSESVKQEKEEKPAATINKKLLTSEEFSSIYGKEHDRREFPVWAATSWNGSIDTSKLDPISLNFLSTSGNYVEVTQGKWIHKILYTSGNIYEKLNHLENENSLGNLDEGLYQKNRMILENAKPEFVKLEKIHFSPMTTLSHEFIVTEASTGEPLNLKEDFVNWVTGCYDSTDKRSWWTRRNFDSASSPISKEDLPPGVNWSDIIEYLDGESVRARRAYGDKPQKAAAIEAEEKRVNRRDTADILFDRYLHEGLDNDTTKRLENEWNKRFNNTVNPDYAKLPLFVDGMSYYKGKEPFRLYDQQIRGISFLGNKGNGLLAYDVGVGKTAAGIVSTVNQIQTKRAKKPLIVVPKSVYSKWYRDIQELFPNITVNDLGNFSEKNLANYRTDDYGLRIPENSISLCTIEALQRISFTDESISGPLFEDFSNLLGGLDDDGSDRARKQQEEKISESIGRASQTKEGFVFWERTNFDHITVDEAHRFKNLFKVPRPKTKGAANEYAGLGAGTPSSRALKLFGMTQLVQRENNNRNVFLLTATPFTNSPLEVYSMMSYMAREKLKEMHLYSLREFMDEFSEMKSEWAVDAKGEIKTKQVMKNFRSLSALQNLLVEYIDKVDGEEAGVIRPRRFTHVQKLELTELQKKIIEAETERMIDPESAKNGGTLVAMNNMRMAMLSPALIRNGGYEFKIPALEDLVNCSPKLKMVCDTVADCWHKEKTGGQIIYMPRGVDESKYILNYLITKGIPENAVGFINSSVSDAKKDSLTQAFNDKDNSLKIIIGSETISEGVDLNGNTFALYNCMLGWNPTETVQVEGRLWRQGNKQGHVHIVYPLMNDSIDALMYQKHDEKSSRINALWSYKGDKLNIEDINPEELKFDLIKNPVKKADLIISERTIGLKTEEVYLDGKLDTISTIIEKQKELVDFIASNDDRMNELKKRQVGGTNNRFIEAMIAAAKVDMQDAEKKLPAIQKKLDGMDLGTPEKVDVYIRDLNIKKAEVKVKIETVVAEKDTIITQLQIEELEKRFTAPSHSMIQQTLLTEIMENLRPMKDVAEEIKREKETIKPVEIIVQLSKKETKIEPVIIDYTTGQYDLFGFEYPNQLQSGSEINIPHENKTTLQPQKMKAKLEEIIHEKEKNMQRNYQEKETVEELYSVKNEDTTIKPTEPRKPHFQQNAENFLAAVYYRSAPFLEHDTDTSAIYITPKAIRSADNGRVFRGANQLLAQIALKEIGSNDTDIITYDQAKRNNAGIRKGSSSFNLTNYDSEKKEQNVYQYYPVSAVYNNENLPQFPKQTEKPVRCVLCDEVEPEKYLGKYLAATAMNARFETTKETQEIFRKNLIKDLEKSFADKHHVRVFEIGNKASAICRETMSEFFSKLQTPTLDRQSSKEKNVTTEQEPHNPLTGEKFIGENAQKALYLMERRNSKDPRFLEVSDILKVGLALKKDAKEILTISTNEKTRFFYNAIDIEGMPPRTRQTQRNHGWPQPAQKEKDTGMEM